MPSETSVSFLKSEISVRPSSLRRLKTTENKLLAEQLTAKTQFDTAQDSLKRHLDLVALKPEDLLAVVNSRIAVEQVKMTYFKLAYLQATPDILLRDDKLLVEMEQTAESRYRVG